MRFGVFGGTFDPPHMGHLRAAEAARDALGLEGVLFVPAARPPHKDADAVTEARHRLEMLRAAVADNGHCEVSTLEIERAGPSYTVDTLGRLTQLYPEREWFFIIGSDAFTDLRTWKEWRRLISDYRLALLARPGFSLSEARAIIPEELESKVHLDSDEGDERVPSGVYVLKAQLLRVSASELRVQVRDGKSIRYLVPEGVRRYIVEHGLYRAASTERR